MADPHAHHPTPDNPEVHHETSDVSVRGLFIFAVSFLVLSAITYLIVYGMFRLLDRRTKATQPRPVTMVQPERPMVPPAPRLQVMKTNPPVEMRQFREREEQILTSLGIDPQTQRIRIPLDRAMELSLQRGLFPSRPAAAPVASGVQPAESGAPRGAENLPSIAPDSGAGLTPQRLPALGREGQPITVGTPQRETP